MAQAFCGSYPGRGKKLNSLEKHPDMFQSSQSSLFNEYWGSFPGDEVARGNIRNPFPLNTEVKNEWGCNATSSWGEQGTVHLDFYSHTRWANLLKIPPLL
jgi:hypothetical protein